MPRTPKATLETASATAAPEAVIKGAWRPSERSARALTIAACAVLALGAFVVSLTPIADGDIFWHLAAGREMVRRHALLRVDPFTVSAAGRPWPDVHWLFQLAAYAVHGTAGLAGLVVTKAALVATGVLLLALTVARTGGRLAVALLAPTMLAALFAARHLLLVRPVIVTLVMLALFLVVLEEARAGRRRWLLVLPLLQIVWTNCQGLSALGPALVGASWAAVAWARLTRPALNAPAARALTLALLGCVAASFVTPFGLDAVALPARLLARLAPSHHTFAVEIAENVPPLTLWRSAPEATAHFVWYLVALGVCLLMGRRSLPGAHALVIAGMGGLALMANRNVLLFYWLATPLAVLAVTPAVRRLLAAYRPASVVGALGGAALLAGGLGAGALAFAREPSIAGPTPFHFPTESARRLAEAGATGPVFAPDHWGGYLELAAPGLVPYIDTRLVLHTEAEYAAFLSAVAHPGELDALAPEGGFRYILLTTSYPDRYLGLVAHLVGDPRWRLVYTDGSEVLFAREGAPIALDDAATIDGIASAIDARWAGQGRGRRHGEDELREAAHLALARLLIVVGVPLQARRVLDTCTGSAAAELRARALLVEGQAAGAESLARVLLADDDRDVRSLTLLARIADARGDAPTALSWLRRALAVDPYDAEAGELAERLATVTRGSP